MKTTRYTLLIVSLIMMGATVGCDLTSYDNYDSPEATLQGAVVHEGDTIRVASSIESERVELEIWEEGYQDYEKIQVYLNQDGTFSAELFEGNYKMTQLLGRGPWVPSSDTVQFDISGDMQMQFEVEPYFKVTDSNIGIGTDAITADFDLQEVNTSRDIAYMTLFLGTSQFVSIGKNSFFWNHLQQGIVPNGNGSNTLSIPLSSLPENLANRDYIYARVAIEIGDVAEDGSVLSTIQDPIYTKVYRIDL